MRHVIWPCSLVEQNGEVVMRHAGTITAVLIAFVVGCGAASVVKFEVPSARANPNSTRWEYHCVNMVEGITQYSNNMGSQGWQMVTAASNINLAKQTVGVTW